MLYLEIFMYCLFGFWPVCLLGVLLDYPKRICIGASRYKSTMEHRIQLKSAKWLCMRKSTNHLHQHPDKHVPGRVSLHSCRGPQVHSKMLQVFQAQGHDCHPSKQHEEEHYDPPHFSAAYSRKWLQKQKRQQQNPCRWGWVQVRHVDRDTPEGRHANQPWGRL